VLPALEGQGEICGIFQGALRPKIRGDVCERARVKQREVNSHGGKTSLDPPIMGDPMSLRITTNPKGISHECACQFHQGTRFPPD